MPDRSGSNIIFLDNSFNPENTQSYILSIQLSATRISCVVNDSSSNSYIGFLTKSFTGNQTLENLDLELNKIIQQVEWLSYPYKKIYALLQTPINTLVPKPFFEEFKSKSYLEFNHTLNVDSVVSHDFLKHIGTYNIFSIDKELSEGLSSHFPAVQIKHFASVFIEAIAIDFKNLMDGKSIYLNVREDYFDLAFFKDNKLVFYNLFRYKTKEDFMYFLLATMEELSLNPEDTQLYLMGEINEGDILHEMIYKYIRHNFIVGRNEAYNYSRTLDEAGHHQYFVLYNLLQCVS